MNPRILIVDDHEIVREGIRNLLARSGKNWEVRGEASNASDAILFIKSAPPMWLFWMSPCPESAVSRPLD